MLNYTRKAIKNDLIPQYLLPYFYLTFQLPDDAKYAPETYYIDITIRNKWRNPISMSGPFDGKLSNITLQPGEERQQIFIQASDSKPKPRFFKFIDIKVGNLIKVNGKSDSISLEYSTYLKPIVINIEDFGK